MSREPVSVASTIFALLSRNPQALAMFWLSILQQEWAGMPEPVPEGTMPLSSDNGTLVIAVRNVVWRQEMAFRQKDIEKAIRDRWPGFRFKKLTFRVAPLPVPPVPARSPAAPALKQRPIARTTPGSPGERVFSELSGELRDSEEPYARSLLRLLESRLPRDGVSDGDGDGD